MVDQDTDGKWVPFRTLAAGDKFGCWGDQVSNYDYPKWCECIKVDDKTGEEIGLGRVSINPHDDVFVETKE